MDDDLQRRLRELADEASPRPGSEDVVVKRARTKRRLVALSAGLAVVLAIGGLAGAATLLGDRDGIRPAPGPEETSECPQPDFDLAVLVAHDATAAEIAALGEQLDADPRVATLEFVRGDRVTRPPGRFGPIRSYRESDHYEVTLAPGMPARTEMFQGLPHTVGGYVPDKECPPKEPQQKFARYFFEVAEGDASASGVLEVTSDNPSICLSLTSDNIIASHLLIEDPDHPRGRSILFTFFDPNDGEEGPGLPFSEQCFNEEQLNIHPPDLQLLIDEPKRFAIDFHRGPEDEPGLIAELVPIGDEEELADPLEDSIKAQGGTIRLQVIPGSVGRGRIAEIALVNETESQILYGHAYELEKQGPRGWRHVRSPDTCEFTQELISVAPGDDVRHPIGPYSNDCDILPLRHGSYRVTKGVELESGEQVPLSVQFVVSPPPAGFLSIDDAVAHLSDKLEVPVALPRELPDNVRLAPKNAVSITTEGGIRSGRLELRFGKNGILSFDFGRAIFDGCGGDDAEQVDINGQPGLMLAKDEYPWTQIIWPARHGDLQATYGIYGSLRGAEMLELARSMPPLDDEATHKTEGCL